MRMESFKDRGRGFRMAAGVLLGITLVLSGSALAQGTNLVYVESNIGSVTNMNSVFAYSNDGAGNLTPIAGSPFLTSGTGWFDAGLETTSLFTDTPLIIDPSGTYLYAVNAHSNTVSEFSIGTGGTLTLITNPPFKSGGFEPDSLALSHNVLHNGDSILSIANKDNDPSQDGGIPSIRTAAVNGAGTMSQVPNAKVSFDIGDYLGSVNATPLAPHFVFGIQLLGADISEIYTYRIVGAGKLEQVSSIGPPLPGEELLGIAFHPTQHVMYVGIPSTNEIAVYTYNALGALTFVNTVLNMGQEVCWFAENAAGTRLYSVETKGGTVTVYDTTNATAPTQLAHLTLSNQPQDATEAAIDPTGNFLYVLGVPNASEVGLPYLHVFSISQNSPYLTELTPVLLNVPANEHPQGVAVSMQ